VTNQMVLKDAKANKWLWFRNPVQVIVAFQLEEVLSDLCRIEALVADDGLYAAGFLSYEAAPAFDQALKVRHSRGFPLLWFGIYRNVTLHPAPPISTNLRYFIGPWKPSISRNAYDRAIEVIRTRLASGDTYQVNFALRLSAAFTGSPWGFFQALLGAQPVDYAAFIDTGRYVVCSVSPELFFRLEDRCLSTRPMKGTAPRGRFLAEDKVRAQELCRSEKERAENAMIVDMVRNDLGRIARAGSVQVSHAFKAERYLTLWQMTSTVTAETDASFCDIMTALFPSASITGAPKVSTMEILANLEKTPRAIYTGSIGFLAPGRRAQFNVAIRTVLVDRLKGRATYGVGSGIVWDSDCQSEYAECRLKARVLADKRPDFSLLETLLWMPGAGYFLLARHLQRLRDSASYFGFPAKMGKIREKLMALAATLPKNQHRVRLLVARDGAISCEASSLAGQKNVVPIQLKLATTPIDSKNSLLFHKTTHRTIYEAAQSGCSDCDEVLLWNERGEITETGIANIVVQLDGELLTPPVSCGLLPGIFRAWLLDEKKIQERVITCKMLNLARRIYLINSVRRWREAILI